MRSEPLANRPRLLVLTDIGGDPDDQQSLIRLMHYANEFEIEGLIASASGIPGELKEKVTRPDLIREIVAAYGEVQEHLGLHATGFPEAEQLRRRIRSGNPERGLAAIGEGRDTDGSSTIVALGDRADARPLNIAIWGGQTDLAQALWRVRADRGEHGLREFSARLRVYDIGDQDGLAGWIRAHCPELFYILPKPSEGADRREAAYRGMYLGGDEAHVSREWMETHIRQGHGPLGALYPPRTWTAPNPHAAIKEGDTPSWFYFLPHGLNDPEHPEWGGWGGRFARAEERYYRDAVDQVSAGPDIRASVWRWRPAFQADFQARLDWGVTDLATANHNPQAVLNDDRSRRVVAIMARSGQPVELSAVGSRDPDGNAWQALWSVYPEAGTFPGVVELEATAGPTTRFPAPRVTEPVTVHVILEVRDDGEPPLSAFRRAVITVQP